MDSMNFGVIILAAGKGTRLKSARPKVLHEVGGQAMLLHVIAAARTVADDIVCVIGHEAAKVEAVIQPLGVSWTLQEQQLGTGHALQQVRRYYQVYGEGFELKTPQHLMVLSGDVPLIEPATLARLKEFHLQQQAAMTILTAVPPNPFGYGRIMRPAPDSAEVSAIVEQKDLQPVEDSAEINSGIYCFETAALFAHLDQLKNQNKSGEYYLTDMAALLRAAGQRVVAVPAEHYEEVLGANTIAEMMDLDRTMRRKKTQQLMAAGVTIFQPETCVIDAQVEVAADTVIEPFVQLLGATRVGANCTLRSYSVLRDSQLGAGVLVRNGCILDHAKVGDGALLGPYAHLRPGSDIGPAAHLGNFVETKNTVLGAGSKANHLSYLGDAVLGAGVNIGAGAITCNYDGVHKHRTTIGDGVFVGSDSTLVAPISIAEGAYIAAGSCITEDVPAEALALGRARQVTKPGWAAERRARSKAKGGAT